MKVVHLAGSSGVGKSFVCARTVSKRIKCLDMDGFFKRHHDKAWKRLEAEVEKVRATGGVDVLVMAGMHELQIPCDARILVSADAEETDRAYLLRNLDAIVTHADRIRRVMKRTKDVNEMQDRVVEALWTNFDITQT